VLDSETIFSHISKSILLAKKKAKKYLELPQAHDK